MFRAVAVAPGLVPPSAWLPLIVPDGVSELSEEEGPQLIGLLIRLQGDVVDAIHSREAMIPDDDDVEECASFAAGYAAGAELDPAWIGQEVQALLYQWSCGVGGALLEGPGGHD